MLLLFVRLLSMSYTHFGSAKILHLFLASYLLLMIKIAGRYVGQTSGNISVV